MDERRVVVRVPATGQQLEATGLLAEMVMLLLARADAILRQKAGRVRITYHATGTPKLSVDAYRGSGRRGNARGGYHNEYREAG